MFIDLNTHTHRCRSINQRRINFIIYFLGLSLRLPLSLALFFLPSTFSFFSISPSFLCLSTCLDSPLPYSSVSLSLSLLVILFLSIFTSLSVFDSPPSILSFMLCAPSHPSAIAIPFLQTDTPGLKLSPFVTPLFINACHPPSGQVNGISFTLLSITVVHMFILNHSTFPRVISPLPSHYHKHTGGGKGIRTGPTGRGENAADSLDQ